MQRSTLYALGVFHFDQIGNWTPEHVAWVEQYLRLGGRIGAFVMPPHKIFQIDSPEDVALCEAIMRGYGLDRA